MAGRSQVLVAYASKMGSTKEIAEVIGQELEAAGRLDAEHATGRLSRWMAEEGPLAGDFRDWTRIRAWASEIARQLDQMTAEGQQ